MPIRISAAAGLALSQIGEFSFVLERAGGQAGLQPAGMADTGSQIFIAVSVLLMVLSPWLLESGRGFGDCLGGRVSRRAEERKSETEDGPGEGRARISGCG